MSRSTEAVRTILASIIKTTNFGQCLKNLEIVSAGEGNCKAKLLLSNEHLNISGTLHGGFTSTLIDCVSSYALVTHKNGDPGSPGVSVDLHVSFMKAAYPGETLIIDAKTIKAGKTLAFLAVDLTTNDGKNHIAHGRHTKFIK